MNYDHLQAKSLQTRNLHRLPPTTETQAHRQTQGILLRTMPRSTPQTHKTLEGKLRERNRRGMATATPSLPPQAGAPTLSIVTKLARPGHDIKPQPAAGCNKTVLVSPNRTLIRDGSRTYPQPLIFSLPY